MEKSSFTIRSYSKSELAMLYSPYITPKAAVRKLNRWIAFKPGLQEQLRASGMLPNAKCYTPLQVHTIVEALLQTPGISCVNPRTFRSKTPEKQPNI